MKDNIRDEKPESETTNNTNAKSKRERNEAQQTERNEAPQTERNAEIKPERNEKALYTQITKSMLVSAIFQLPYLMILYIFYNLALLITMDVLYFPPVLNFSIGNYYLWNTVFWILFALLILQIVVAILTGIMKKSRDSMKFLRLIKAIAVIQLIYLPIGTFYGLLELQLAKNAKNTPPTIKMQTEELKNHDSESSTQYIFEMEERKIGSTFIGIGVHWLGVLLFMTLLTYYFAAVMLDMTYPYLTMSILLKTRVILGSFILISLLQMFFGQFYYRIPNSRAKRLLFWLFWLWSLLLIPIGTSYAILIRKMQKAHSLK